MANILDDTQPAAVLPSAVFKYSKYTAVLGNILKSNQLLQNKYSGNGS